MHFDSRVAICDDSIKSNLMEVWGFKLQHLMYALLVNLIRRGTNFLWCAICAAKSRVDELFTVFVKEVEGIEVRACRDLDQLGKAISDLGGGEGAEEGEIQEGVYRCMVSTKAVLIVAIIDGDLDRH